MALIASKTYMVDGAADYECTYWRISKISLDVDNQVGKIYLKGYKTKQYRIDNGLRSNFPPATICVRVTPLNWVFTLENLAQYNSIQLGYMAVKQSPLDEGIGIDWSQAQDDLSE